jgi:hypothetical protein
MVHMKDLVELDPWLLLQVLQTQDLEAAVAKLELHQVMVPQAAQAL